MPATWRFRSVVIADGPSLKAVESGVFGAWQWGWAGAASAGGLEGRALGRGLHLFLVAGGLGVFLADPVVALALEQLDQLGAAILDDPAAEEDVDELGLDVGEDPLVVGDDQNAGA